MNYDNITTSRKQFFFWERKVQRFFREHNIDGFSDVDSEPEGFFTWDSCRCCGSPLGGTKHEVEAYDHKADEIIGPWSVCEDCYLYAEFGHIGDIHMLDLGRDAQRLSGYSDLAFRLTMKGWTFKERQSSGYETTCNEWTKADHRLLVFTDDTEGTVIHVERTGR